MSKMSGIELKKIHNINIKITSIIISMVTANLNMPECHKIWC